MAVQPTLTTLASFNGTDGSHSYASLYADAAGNLFGTTSAGGANGDGVVFELAKTAGGYAAAPTVLISFSGSDGSRPYSDLIADSNGDLFGTTTSGGANSDGTVFVLAKTGTSYASAPNTLVAFDGTDGSNPYGSLFADIAGNLFGTASTGGANSDGTLFEIPLAGGSYATTPTTLAIFNGTDGGGPRSGLLVDPSGDLFGTTLSGSGTSTDGTVFELVKTAFGYVSAPTTLASFNGTNGQAPEFNTLIADTAGDLFGTTYYGGASGVGAVFEIAKTATGYSSTPILLASLTTSTGANPYGGLIIDAAGNLFGTTDTSGPHVGGTVFEIAKTATGYAAAPTLVISFTGNGESGPSASLIADAAGDLFGTTYSAGVNNDGTVFEITNSGYVVACFAQGTRIATVSGEVAVEGLAIGDEMLTADGASRPVVWLGRRRVACRTHPRQEDVLPVRIAAGAFGPGLPMRDLMLSPDHAVFVEGVLIPIRCLINSHTIVQEPAESVTYFHVELDLHDVLLAEGLPCESYLDTGNRACFANAGVEITAHPSFGRGASDVSCAPLVMSGPVVERTRAALGTRMGKDVRCAIAC